MRAEQWQTHVQQNLMANWCALMRYSSKSQQQKRFHTQISDLLREMLLSEESENTELYSEAEKSELLWRIFEHIALGGPCCQFEVGGPCRARTR